MSITFKTIKIDSQELPMFRFSETINKDGKTAGGKSEKSFDQPVHPDFKKAMNKLTRHLIAICEEVKAISSLDQISEEIVSSYVVRGFHRGNNEEMPGVTIVGGKILKSGKIMGMNAPFMRFYEDTGNENTYPFQFHLEGVLSEIEIEGEEYLDGKFRPDPQPELPFGHDTEENDDSSKTTVNVLETESGSAFEPIAVKKGRKKKEAVTE